MITLRSKVYGYWQKIIMDYNPLSPKWFIQTMTSFAVAGMTIPLAARATRLLKDEMKRPVAVEQGT